MNGKTKKSFNTVNSASIGILIVYTLSILHSIQTIHRQPVIEFIPHLIVILLALFTMKEVLGLKTKRETFNSPYFILTNLFGIFIIVSTLYSKIPLLSLTRSLQFILCANCLYILCCNANNLERVFYLLAKTTVIITCVACLYAIGIYKLGSYQLIDGVGVYTAKFFGINFHQKSYGNRLPSFFGNPNPFGIRIAISILFCLYLLKKNRRIHYIFIIALLLYGLVLTGSRASFIALLCGLFLYFSIAYIKNDIFAKIIKTSSIVFSILIAIFVLSYPEIIKGIFSLIGRESSTLSGREIAWTALIEQIKNTPFFGIGYRISTEYILIKNHISVSNSHNLYLSILSEVGALGFLLFFVLYLVPLIYGYIYSLKTKSLFICTTIAIIATMMINQAFEDMYSALDYFFITLMLLLSLVSLKTNNFVKNEV